MDTKKKIIIGICVVAIIVAIYFGYKSLAKTLGLDDNPGNGDYKPNNGNTTGGSGSAGGSSNGGTENNSEPQGNKTNNDSPVLYEVGEKLFTYGEYANVRETVAVINKTIDNNLLNKTIDINLLGSVKGEIGIVEAVVNGTNKNDTHKWYKVKLTTPIRKMLFLEYDKGYVRDDVVTNQK